MPGAITYQMRFNVQPESINPILSVNKSKINTVKNMTPERYSNNETPKKRSANKRASKVPLEVQKNSREKIDAIIHTNNKNLKFVKAEKEQTDFNITQNSKKQMKLTLEQCRGSTSQDITQKFSMHDRLNSKFARKRSLNNQIMT